jgi:hypothetical protein
VPNFKSDADEGTGVVAGNELAGSYQRLGTAPIVAWERLDGSKEIITGRHRFDLAQRSGETTIPTQIVREADGFTADMAKTFDAESNIRDGQGDVSDYANYFRNSPQLTEAQAAAGGLLARAKGQAGFDLGKHAGDDLYALYQNGKIAEPKAVAIARAAPGNPDLQALGIHQAAVGRSVPEIVNFIKAVGLETGGGAEQIDMFGRNDAALQQAEAMSKRATKAQSEINDQIRAVQAAAKRPEAADKLGVNVADPAGVLNKISELKGELDRWQNWPLHQDLVELVGGKKVEVKPPMPKQPSIDEQVKTLSEKFPEEIDEPVQPQPHDNERVEFEHEGKNWTARLKNGAIRYSDEADENYAERQLEWDDVGNEAAYVEGSDNDSAGEVPDDIWEKVPKHWWKSATDKTDPNQWEEYYTVQHNDEDLGGWGNYDTDAKHLTLKEALEDYHKDESDNKRLVYYDGTKSGYGQSEKANFDVVTRPSFVQKLLDAFPGMTKEEAQRINRGRNPENEDPYLVAQAYARHNYTDYESKLKSAKENSGEEHASDFERNQARREIKDVVDAQMAKWRSEKVTAASIAESGGEKQETSKASPIGGRSQEEPTQVEQSVKPTFKVGDKVLHQGQVKTVTRVVPGSEFIGVGKRAVNVRELQPVPKPEGEIIGMGGAVPSEFSPASVADAIDPTLRTGMVQTGGPEALHTPTQSHLNTVLNAITGKSLDLRDAAFRAHEAFKGWLGTVAGKTLPKTTLRDRVTGEYGGRYAASGAAAHPAARLFTTDVLTGLKIDQGEFDAALKADNLLSVKDGYNAEAAAKLKAAGEAASKGDNIGAEKLKSAASLATENAGKVNTLLGQKGFPFKDEAELQKYFKQPEVAEAIKRHKDNWQAVVDAKYRVAAGIDPNLELASRGRYSGARVNLNPVRDGDVVPANGKIISTQPGGNLTGTFQRRTGLARRATGQGERYVLDYHTSMQNTFAKLLEIANKREFDDQLVKSGNAVIDDVGKQVTLPDGSVTKGYPLIRKGFVNKNIYVRQSLATEYAYAANAVLNPWRGGLIEGANKTMAQAALFGLTDATTHVMNLGTAMFQVPGSSGTGLLTDSILSAMGRADIAVTMARAMSKKALEFIGSPKGAPLQKYIPDSIMASVNQALLKRTSQMARLAEMNAMRQEHGGRIPVVKQLGAAVGEMDQVARLTLHDIYDNLVQQGLVKNTETQAREFVNQAGNYNIRTVGPIMHFLRETWIAPFATAGRNFAVLGVRGATLNPAVEATSFKAAAALRANMAMKWIGTYVGLVGTVNYLISGRLTGYPGTPLGTISWKDKDGKVKYFNVAAMTGQARALRTIGARGAIEATRNGLPPGDAATAALRDVVNTGAGTLAGPGVRVASIAATGFAPAMQVGRVSDVAPQGGLGQIGNNLKAAALQATPIGQIYQESQKPGATAGDVLATQARRLALNPGKSETQVDNFPRIVSMAQAKDFTEWVISTARKVPLDNGQRAQYVVQQIQRLPASEQKAAHNEVLRRRVLAP